MKFLESLLSIWAAIGLGLLVVFAYADHKEIYDFSILMEASKQDVFRLMKGPLALLLIQPFIFGGFLLFKTWLNREPKPEGK